MIDQKYLDFIEKHTGYRPITLAQALGSPFDDRFDFMFTAHDTFQIARKVEQFTEEGRFLSPLQANKIKNLADDLRSWGQVEDHHFFFKEEQCKRLIDILYNHDFELGEAPIPYAVGFPAFKSDVTAYIVYEFEGFDPILKYWGKGFTPLNDKAVQVLGTPVTESQAVHVGYKGAKASEIDIANYYHLPYHKVPQFLAALEGFTSAKV